MKRLENESFVGLFDRASARTFADLELTKCRFEGCGLSVTRSPAQRSIVQNVSLVQCEQRGCIVNGAIFDSVVVDGLKTHGLLQTWGAVFRHVTFRGKIGRVMLSRAVASGTATQEEQRAFDDANARFYAGVDWAIDISQAEFEECDARGVPGALVRRDPATQVLVTRHAAIAHSWRDVDLSGTYWATALDLFMESQAPDVVLVAPKRSKNFERLRAALEALRECGVAERE
jgi:hypothetical protein